MAEHEIDFGCFQENKIPTNSKFKIKDYAFITSTDITGGTKPKKKEEKGKGRPKQKGKDKGNGKGKSKSLHQDREVEHHGVMIVYHKNINMQKQLNGSNKLADT